MREKGSYNEAHRKNQQPHASCCVYNFEDPKTESLNKAACSDPKPQTCECPHQTFNVCTVGIRNMHARNKRRTTPNPVHTTYHHYVGECSHNLSLYCSYDDQYHHKAINQTVVLACSR